MIRVIEFPKDNSGPSIWQAENEIDFIMQAHLKLNESAKMNLQESEIRPLFSRYSNILFSQLSDLAIFENDEEALMCLATHGLVSRCAGETAHKLLYQSLYRSGLLGNREIPELREKDLKELEADVEKLTSETTD